MLFNEQITWVTFHGGFDFAYFVKILTDKKLPASCKEFYDYFRCFFPYSIDVKLVIQDIEAWKFHGLEKLSKCLEVTKKLSLTIA